MRARPRLDANHNDIVKALRAVGASVQSLASVGGGCPDILVGVRKVNAVFEIKDGTQSPSRRALTDDEKDWHAAWRGTVYVIESVEQALQVVASL